MNRTTLNILHAVLALAIATGAAIAAGTPAPAPQPEKKEPIKRDRYDALVDHNIFLKERGRRDTGYGPGGRNGSTTQSVQPIRTPEANFVLTGIVIEEGQYRAYVEDVSSGRVLRLAVGDPVARGHVVEIEIDAIGYEQGGQGTWVSVGCDLRGQAFNSFGSPRPYGGGGGGAYASGGSSTTTGPSSGGGGVAVSPLPLDPNNPNLTTEERMRLRRQQGK